MAAAALGVPPELLTFLNSSIGFVVGIKKAYDYVANWNSPSVEEILKEGFTGLISELTSAVETIKVVIVQCNINTLYAPHERNIRKAAEYLDNYLKTWREGDEAPSQPWKKLLVDHHEHLRDSVQALMEGLLGVGSFSHDLLSFIVEFEKGRPGKIRKRLEKMMVLVNVGILVHAASVGLNSNMLPETSVPVGQKFGNLYEDIIRRVNAKIGELEKEDTVISEMLEFMFPGWNIGSHEYSQALADKIYQSLLEKYDSKQWLVIVPGFDHRFEGCVSQLQNMGFHLATKEFVWTSHVVSALAKSFPPNHGGPFPFNTPGQAPEQDISWWVRYVARLGECFESPDKLARILHENEPRNDYLVLTQKSFHLPKPIVMLPKDSPLTNVKKVGLSLHVFATQSAR